MASSFASQIPIVTFVIAKISPKHILDIGKGFGKYGFLIHEYIGINTSKKPIPNKTLKEQSCVQITAVDINKDYNFIHLDHFYEKVDNVDIITQFSNYTNYDLILMCDVIEHLPKEPALNMLRHFLKQNAKILISTPNKFFNQDLYQSEAEHHISFWQASDFRKLGCHVDYQRVNTGTIFLLTTEPINIRGFGRGLLKRLRRVARCLHDEICAN